MVDTHPQAILEIVARVLGYLTLLLFIVSVRINRRGPHQCQHCGFDRTGLDQPLCPECGKEQPKVIPPALAFRPRWLFWGVSFLLFYVFLKDQLEPIAALWYEKLPANVCIKADTVRGLRYRIMTDRPQYLGSLSGTRGPNGTIQMGNAAWAQVERDGIWEDVVPAEYRWRVNVAANPPRSISQPIDLTGDGVGEVFFINIDHVEQTRTVIIIFDPQTKQRLAEIGRDRSEVIDYVDLDNDGVPELKIADRSFVYWRRARTPDSIVILSLKGGTPRVRTDLMQTPALPESELRDLAQSLAVGPDNQPRSPLWKAMLDLLYGGHPDQANQLLTLAWPDAIPREEFRAEFFDQLEANSQWWALIRTQLHDAPP